MSDFSVPGTHHVLIDDHAYLLDTNSEQFRYETIPLLNPTSQLYFSQSASQVSESSLNPEGLWRRSQESWHKGAGQTYLDKVDSDAARFRTSLGVDVWSKGEISLLNDVTKLYTGTPKQMVWQGGKLFISDGVNIRKYSDVYTPGAATVIDINMAEPDETVRSIINFGLGVLAALGPNGLHFTDGVTQSHYSDLNADVIAYVAGRLMGAKNNNVYNVTTVPAAPTALYSHPDSLFQWVGFAEAKGYIFMAGSSIISDKSFIYKTSIKPDGTALDIPSVSAPLPEGEKVTAIYGYLNFILIGTNNGVRFAVPDTNGNLEIGALLETASPVLCFEGQESFVWFGWSNYDGTHTGLGRCDLRTFINGVAPAYATDLMAVDQGSITSIVTDPINNRRIFADVTSGVYVESGNKVPSGEINSGYITYNLPEEKEARFVDVRYRDLRGTDTVYLSTQDGIFQFLRTNTSTDYVKRIPAGNLIGDMLEIKHVFTRSVNDLTVGPILTRHTLKSQVKVNMGAYWYLPLILASEEVTQANNERHRDVLGEFLYLAALAGDKQTVTLKILAQTYSVTVEDTQFVPSNMSDDKTAFNGTMIVKLKVSV